MIPNLAPKAVIKPTSLIPVQDTDETIGQQGKYIPASELVAGGNFIYANDYFDDNVSVDGVLVNATASAKMSSDGNIVYGLLDNNTGETLSYRKVVLKPNGSPYTNADIDNVIIRKKGINYYKGDFKKISIKRFGAKCDFNPLAVTGTDDTASIQKAINAIYANGGGTLLLGGDAIKTKGTLQSYENVNLIGEGYDSNNVPISKGCIIYHLPDVPDTDFLVVSRSNIGNYSDLVLRDFRVEGSKVNTRDIMKLSEPKCRVTNVIATTCAGKAWNITGAINCMFLSCGGHNADYGMYLGGPSYNTSTSFVSCYFGGACRIGAYVGPNCNSTEFTNWTIFESSLDCGLIAESSVSLVNPYFENVTNELIRAGVGVAVEYVKIFGGIYIGGGFNEELADMFYMDNVKFVHLDIIDCRIPKASVLRTTALTGGVCWNCPDNILVTSATARANSTAYGLRVKRQAVCNDGRTRVFISTVAGVSSATLPSFTRIGTTVDGTVAWKLYSADAIYDQSKAKELDNNIQKGRLMAGKFSTRFEDIIYDIETGYANHVGDFSITRENGQWPLLYSRPTDDKISMGGFSVSATHRIRQFLTELYSPAGSGLDAVKIKQDDQNKSFAYFEGATDASGTTKPITTWKSGAVIQGFMKINVDGTDRFLPYYSAPTGA